MLLAVIEKRGGMKLSQKDVFLNITGGLKIQDPAIDLSMVCAILSSFFDFYIDHKICFIGEVGLSGEIRPVSRIEQRIKEVTKMGIKYIYLSKYSKINHKESEDYQLIKVKFFLFNAQIIQDCLKIIKKDLVIYLVSYDLVRMITHS